MSIDVLCPTCDKSYKVKDEAAGKKLRCKACQTLIPIPEAVEEADPWDAVDEQSQEPWDDEEEEAAPPPVVRAGKKKPAKASRSGGGMPVTIIVALCINGLLIAANLFGMVSMLSQGGAGGRTGGSIARLIIEISIIRGLINRSDRIRRNSIMLDIIGLVVIAIVAAVVMFGPRQGGMDKTTLMVIFVVQGALWIADMVVLMSPSAKEFCNE